MLEPAVATLLKVAALWYLGEAFKYFFWPKEKSLQWNIWGAGCIPEAASLQGKALFVYCPNLILPPSC